MIAKDLKVTSIRYFETRRGLGYECRTNVKGLSIWNDGNGGQTFFDGNEYTKNYKQVSEYNNMYNDSKLEELIDEFEGVKNFERSLRTENGLSVEDVKEYFLNTGNPDYEKEPYISYTGKDWIELANEYDLER